MVLLLYEKEKENANTACFLVTVVIVAFFTHVIVYYQRQRLIMGENPRAQL